MILLNLVKEHGGQQRYGQWQRRDGSGKKEHWADIALAFMIRFYLRFARLRPLQGAENPFPGFFDENSP